MSNEIMVAKTTALVEHDGRRIVIKQGITTAHADHEIVDKYPDLWERQSVHFDTDKTRDPKQVETTTAAPGERRALGTSKAPSRRGRKETDEK